MDALLRAPQAALATSSSTNAGGPELDGTRKFPPSAGANPSSLAPRPAAEDEEYMWRREEMARRLLIAGDEGELRVRGEEEEAEPRPEVCDSAGFVVEGGKAS